MLIKLCDIYNVSDILAEFRNNNNKHRLSEHGKAIVIAYRNKLEMQSLVDTLLSIKRNTESEIASDMTSIIEKGERISMKACTGVK